MNRLAGAFILAALALPSSPGRAGTGASTAPIDVDAAIVFAADISWSMDARELRVVREGHAEAITAPEVLDAISRGAIGRVAVTYIEFAGAARQMVDWMVIDGRPSAERFAAAIRAIEGATEPYTDISAAFYLADSLFAAMPYRATNKVVDVVGDGTNGLTTWLKATREVLVEHGVVINGMPLVIHPSEPNIAALYGQIVVGGAGAFVLPVMRIEEMPMAMRRKIERELY